MPAPHGVGTLPLSYRAQFYCSLSCRAVSELYGLTHGVPRAACAPCPCCVTISLAEPHVAYSAEKWHWLSALLHVEVFGGCC